ncbi:dihydroorotase [Candidatus Bathyarchaeota archaeon]|nr:MAG: dihydroorotase [Candidatus Bathyarchaeota archaeon]
MNAKHGRTTSSRKTARSYVLIALGTLNNLKSPESEKTSGLPSLIIRDANIWTKNDTTRGSILIEHGRIQKIARNITERADEEILANGLLVLPGLVDAHVHLRDMNLSYKEDFTTGTAAAAAGGFTSVIDMPNSLPPTDSAERLRERARRASGKILVNVGFHAAAVKDQDAANEMKSAGAFSMKLYLPNPIAPLDIDDDRVVVQVLDAAKQASLLLTVHAEDATKLPRTGEIKTFAELVRLRRGNAETSAVRRILRLQRRIGCRVHFCHVSLPSSLSAISNLSSSRLSSEVTPHHTLLSENHVMTLGWKAWMVPPLRSPKDTRKLFHAMKMGIPTIMATDHAPHTVKEKARLPRKSSPGIPGLETALSLMLTMVNNGKLSLGRLVSLLSNNPAKVFDLRSKGRLESGADGDLVLVDLKKRGTIDPEKFFSKAHYSPFEGWKTQGAVHTTIVNGLVVYRDGEIVAKPGGGKVLKSGRHE